ncbi:MAG: hypothetical protein ABIJ27_07625 [Candidatus Omnitrophota bacterium]
MNYKKIAFNSLALFTIMFVIDFSLTRLTARGQAAVPAVEEPEEDPQMKASRLQRQAEAEKLAAEKKAELLGTKWNVSLELVSEDADGYPETDVLSFEDNKFTSAYFTEKGFEPTNFTVKVANNGTVVWETLQTKDEIETIIWRGERLGDSMKGTFTHKFDGVPRRAYTHNFTSQNLSAARPNDVKGLKKIDSLRATKAENAAVKPSGAPQKIKTQAKEEINQVEEAKKEAEGSKNTKEPAAAKKWWDR